MAPEPQLIEEGSQTHQGEQPLTGNGNTGNTLPGRDIAGRPGTSALDKETEGADEEASLEHSRFIVSTLSLPREILFVGIICLAQFTTQVSLGQTLFILPVIGCSFKITDPSQLSWLIAGYSLTVGTFIIISGRLGDIFGYKRMLIIGFTWFAGLSVYSNNVLFVFARVFQGIGPAITLPNGVALLGSTYPPGPRKDMVFALFGACAPGGSIVGGAFAGLFALTWWPWAFFRLAITLVILVGITHFIIPHPPKRPEYEGRSLRDKLKLIDFPGAAVGVTALVLFNFAWNQAPLVGWQKPYVYVTMILGLLLLPLFFYIEFRISSSPLVPFEALTVEVSFVLAYHRMRLVFFCFLEILRGASPLLAVAYLSPVAVAGALASVCTGLILSRLRAGWVMVIALAAFTVGQILVATAPVHQTYWAQIFVCTIVIPWGMDMSFPAANLILSNSVSKKHQGIAASLVNTIVNYSISLDLGFAGTVEVHVNKHRRMSCMVIEEHGTLAWAWLVLGWSSAAFSC